MPTVADICDCLNEIAPLDLAAEWDNVGLLLGDPAAEVKQVMTCLTPTPDVAAEAVAKGVDLVVTHHPIFFKPVQRVTAETWEGAVILKLAAAGCAVYSAHTAWDDAAAGINSRLAGVLRLQEVGPLVPDVEAGRDRDLTPGHGRVGRFAGTFDELIASARAEFGDRTRASRPGEEPTTESDLRVAVACGAGGSYLKDAINAGARAFVTGEMRFHDLLAAREAAVVVILLGHYVSEKFAIAGFGEAVAGHFDGVEVFDSVVESDPLFAE